MRFRRLLAALALCAAGAAVASPLSLYEQRQAYRQALEHLAAGRTRQFQHARAALDDYALAPYLDYYAVRARLRSLTDEEMAAFQSRHGDLPVAAITHFRWLKSLGERHQWQRLLDNYRPTADPSLNCYRLRALAAGGHEEEAFGQVAPLWTVDHSQPKACDPLFDAWIHAGRLTQGRAWERLQLALEAGQRRLGRYLLRFFEGPLSHWARALYDVHNDPERVSRPSAFPEDTPYSRVVIRHGLVRLAGRDPDRAARAWRQYQDTHEFSTEDAQALTEAIILAQARAGTFPEHRLTGLSADFSAGMADAAIEAQRWPDVYFYIEQLPTERQRELRWQYWRARSMDGSQIGTEQARLTYRTLAGERNYYGFLAAVHVGSRARLNRVPHQIDPRELAALQRVPAVNRALELYAVGDRINARREWFALLPDLTMDQRYHAALLAQDAGWIALGIFTANAADLRDNLELRFPVAYADVFQNISNTTTVPQPFLMAIARQESAFDPRARSGANARGLMQLMHPTAKLVADRIGIADPSVSDLYDPTVNVRLGGHHLARLLARYDDRRPLAAAAYNAGEHRVDRWVKDAAGMPTDVWIERIPYAETRDYVKNVLAFTQVYGELLGQTTPMLDDDESVID